VILDDQLLLNRYAGSRDAEAFAQLVQRYSAMVYAVACRVTGNVAIAEDITQDCFLTLARQATTIRGSLPAWLHRVAINRSLELARSNAARRQREAAASAIRPGSDATWNEIAPMVDTALQELPDGVRELLVQRFLVGRTQAQLAETMGVNQATISRRLTEGVEMLREHMRRAGYVCGAAVLVAGLSESTSAAVPHALGISLAKMAMAGPAKAATGGAIATFVAANIKAIGAVAAVLLGAATLTYEMTPSATSSSSGPAPSPRAHLAKLQITGDPDAQDSFSLTFQAAASACGRNTDYETVYATSTNSFAPAIAIQQRGSKAYWHLQAWTADKCIDALAKRYGLNARQLDAGIPTGKAARNSAIEQAVIQELDAGNVVIACRGWHNSEGLVTPYAGIVTAAGRDGLLFGITLNSGQGSHLDGAGNLWTLSPGTQTLTSHEADVATLRSAVARIRSQPPFQSNSSRTYGTAAMDAWIQAMCDTPGFCPCNGCQSRLHQASLLKLESAYVNAISTTSACEVTARYLRRIAADFPEAARPHIESAAGHYDRIVALLTPAMQETGPESYVTILGDLMQQRAHAARVLTPVRSEYIAAAREIELALNAGQ
jgi:RNA polymerase sigma factor (sigma-70 family)